MDLLVKCAGGRVFRSRRDVHHGVSHVTSRYHRFLGVRSGASALTAVLEPKMTSISKFSVQLELYRKVHAKFCNLGGVSVLQHEALWRDG